MAFQRENKIQEFRADALRVGAELPAMKSAFAPSGLSGAFEAEAKEVSKPSLGELFNVSGSAAYQNERELGLKSTSLDGAGGSGATASARITAQQDLEVARRKASNDTAMFLQMLNLLTEEIAALEAQIEAYDNQIEATDSLIGILANGGEIDPTDSEHQRLLKLAGIPEDEWGTVTLDDLRRHREELQAQRDAAKTQLHKKVAEGASQENAASRIDQGLPVSSYSIEPREAVQEYARRNPDVDLEDLSRRDLLEIRKINLVSEYVARSELGSRDVEWFKVAYAELNLRSDQGVLLENSVDMLVEALEDNSREMLLKEGGLDPVLVGYLVEDKIHEIQSSLNLSDPELAMFVEMAVVDLSTQAQMAIVQSSTASPELKSIVEQQLVSDGVDPTISIENTTP